MTIMLFYKVILFPHDDFIVFVLQLLIIIIVLATRFSHNIFHNPELKNKVIEPEIKFIFMLLFIFMYFANLGNGQAVLPAFVLGLLMSGHFTETSETKVVRNRLRTVAYAVITPIFFIVAGLKVSLPLIASALGAFAAIFIIRQLTKFTGVYFFAKKYIPEGKIYTTLLLYRCIKLALSHNPVMNKK